MDDITCLVGRWCNGDDSVQYKVFNTLRAEYYQLCYKITGDTFGANEAFQIGTMHVYNCFHKYSGIGSFNGWLYTIYRRVSIDFNRRKHEVATEDRKLDIAALSYQPDYEFFDDPKVIRARETFKRMDLRDRRILVLRGIHKQTFKEISKKVGLDVSTVTRRYWNAMWFLNEM